MAAPVDRVNPDELYQEVSATFAEALDRLARAYEADAEKRRDLLQDIHLALWRSFAHFAQRCSLRTWVYRVAHNTAASHVLRQRRMYAGLVALEEVEAVSVRHEPESAVDRRTALERLLVLVQKLKPLDRQIVLSYLEGLDAASIAEITGMSPANVSLKIHRIKSILARRFQKGGPNAG